MHIEQLWRYPVKSMAGERLSRVWVSAGGVDGDRTVQVRDAAGHMLTARRYPALLGLQATQHDDGEPRVNGRLWSAPETIAAVRTATVPDAMLVRNEDPERFDILPLLVATDGAIAALGIDGRRLRPNIVVGGVPGTAERDWPGRTLHIGGVAIRLDSLRGRCVMTTWDPDTLVQDPSVLRRIARDFGGKVALNADVLTPGWLSAGDSVVLA
jgi:uncharacterized protein YcbX